MALARGWRRVLIHAIILMKMFAPVIVGVAEPTWVLGAGYCYHGHGSGVWLARSVDSCNYLNENTGSRCGLLLGLL